MKARPSVQILLEAFGHVYPKDGGGPVNMRNHVPIERQQDGIPATDWL
jgi:hypothetical protein